MTPVRSVCSIPFISMPLLGLPAAEGVQHARPVGLLSQLVRGKSTRSGGIISYPSADAFYASHGSRSLYPRIYGLVHYDSKAGIDAMRELIGRCCEQGAGSIGLELAPSTWNNEIIKHYFKTLGLYAQSIGMKVIFLLTDELWKDSMVVHLSSIYVGSDGCFDAVALRDRIRRIRSDIEVARKIRDNFECRSYGAPEMVSLVQDMPNLERDLSRLEAVKEFLDGIDYDMDAFARIWVEKIAGVITDTMSAIITEQRPDVAFMGYGHAADLPPIAGYEIVDVGSLSAPDDFPATLPVRSSAFYKAIAREYYPLAAARFFLNVGPLVQQLTGSSDHEIAAAVLDRAVHLDPDVFKLAMRAFWYSDPLCTSALSPHHDIDYLKMDVTEAQQRIQKTLRRANRRRRIRKWLWPF